MTDDHGTDLIEQQIAQGQFFLAYDTYRTARDTGAGNLRITLLGALALLRSGAVEEARRVLVPLWPRLESRSLRRERVTAAFRDAVHHTRHADHTAPAADLGEAMDRLLTELERTRHADGDHDGADSPQVLRLVSEVQLEIWLRLHNPSDLSQALRAAQQAADLTGELTDQLQAARLAALSSDISKARQWATVATQHLNRKSPNGSDKPGGARPASFQDLAHAIELAVLLEQSTALEQALAAAVALRPRHLPSVVALLRQMDMLQGAGLTLAAKVRDGVQPPSLVVFAGQALDAPGAAFPCFPPELEPVVAKAIASQLDAIGAEVGFCSASSGSELLCVEAMLDRGAEVHLFLPFSEADFIRHRVAYAGGRWERRFHSACKLATSITYATEEAFLGHDALLRFNNHLIQGMAQAQAQLNLTQPHLVLVWDYAADSSEGSAADFMDNWPDIGTLHLIDLDELREQMPSPGPNSTLEPVHAVPQPLAQPLLPLRHIRTMLFADIVGYSKLKEQDLPLLWRCLEGVKSHLTASGAELRLIESWGDAIYAVMDNSLDMATYAMALIDAVAEIGTANGRLSQPLQVRIGLHAGPVFEGVHPLTGRQIVYGSHVSRAARIEPVSLPGHAYASQQFVAMLLAEESAQAHKAQMTGQTHQHRYDCEYLGMLSLAKNYGRQQVYHLRKAT